MKKIIAPTLTGMLFLTAVPTLMLNISAFFPVIADIYATIENAARGIIPDEIEQIVSALSDKLS